MENKNRSVWYIVTFTLIGLIIGVILTANFNVTLPTFATKGIKTEVSLGSDSPVPQDVLALQNTGKAFTAVSKEVTPSVVYIKAKKVVKLDKKERYHQGDPFEDWPFPFRFRMPDRPEQFRSEAAGSGIIVNKEGYILTNNHVVGDAPDLEVLLNDNRKFSAKLIGKDPLTDVAVIKIEGKDLPVARLGDSDKLDVGEWVLAVGNPFELYSTVTAGIVSAKGRQLGIIPNDEGYSVEYFIQTDAAINPGNSGGALVNLRAEVIGVNTAIASTRGSYEGYGFAIPINLARKVMDDLIKYGSVKRGYLGVSIGNVDEEAATALNVPHAYGVIVQDFQPNSAGKDAGLRVRDVITEIDGQEVRTVNQLQSIIARHYPGDEVILTVFREGRDKKITVKLRERKVEKEKITKLVADEPSSGIGIEVGPIPAEVKDDTNGQTVDGVMITDVDRLSPASEKLQEKWIITEVNGKKIKNVKDFEKAVDGLKPADVVTLRVFPPTGKGDISSMGRYVFIRVPEKK